MQLHGNYRAKLEHYGFGKLINFNIGSASYMSVVDSGLSELVILRWSSIVGETSRIIIEFRNFANCFINGSHTVAEINSRRQ